MKKQILLIILVSLLFGCNSGGSSSNDPPTVESTGWIIENVDESVASKYGNIANATAYFSIWLDVVDPDGIDDIVYVEISNPDDRYWVLLDRSSDNDFFDPIYTVFFANLLYSSDSPNAIILGQYRAYVQDSAGNQATATINFSSPGTALPEEGFIYSEDYLGSTVGGIEMLKRASVTNSIKEEDSIIVEFQVDDARVYNGYVWLYNDSSEYITWSGYFKNTINSGSGILNDGSTNTLQIQSSDLDLGYYSWGHIKGFHIVLTDGTQYSPDDNWDHRSISSYIIFPDKLAPVADAGPDQNVGIGSLVTLNGSGSYDANKDALTYKWEFVSVPDGSSAVLSDVATVNPSFTADFEGIYEVSLIVNDGTEDSNPDIVIITAHRYISALNGRVVDAEYITPLDKIAMISSSPDQLHIYDPIDKESTSVDLPLAPTCVSVSPDGLYAVVGHDYLISYINLTTAVLEKSIDISTSVYDIVLAGNGYAYVFPNGNGWTKISSINIITEIETQNPNRTFISERTTAKLHPNGEAIYGISGVIRSPKLEKYSIINGTTEAAGDYSSEYGLGRDLWISEDGLRIFTSSGNIYLSPNDTDNELIYYGSLNEQYSFKHMSNSTLVNKVIAIPQSDAEGDTQIKIYAYDSLVFEKSIDLPYFFVGNSAYPGYGKFVFISGDGSKLFVVIQADESSGIINEFGIVSYKIN